MSSKFFGKYSGGDSDDDDDDDETSEVAAIKLGRGLASMHAQGFFAPTLALRSPKVRAKRTATNLAPTNLTTQMRIPMRIVTIAMTCTRKVHQSRVVS